MIALRLLLLATVAMGVPTVALAQTQPAPPPPAQSGEDEEDDAEDEGESEEEAEETDVEEVTVTGARRAVRTSIDSISYSMAEDLQAANGTLADALRNVPSVDVDVQGNASLRGESVRILIDGRPSAVLEGPGRAAAILQMSASRFTRIEIMTNPSAAFSPDGGGGIINLITDPDVEQPESSYSGSVRANVGAGGRYNLSMGGSWQRDRLTLTADAGLRQDVQRFETARVRDRLDTLSGQLLESRQSFANENDQSSDNVRLAAEYKLDDITQFNIDLSRYGFRSSGFGTQRFESDDASGVLVADYDRRGESSYGGAFTSASVRMLRQFAEDHDWTTSLSYELGDFDNEQRGVIDNRLPLQPLIHEVVTGDNPSTEVRFSTVYNRPFTDGGKIRTGYEIEFRDLEFDNRVARGPTAEGVVVDPRFTNLFRVEEVVQALYGTYQRPFGDDFAAQVGLRLENVDMDLDQVTSGEQVSNSYFRVYPTLHVDYSLTDTQTLRASYSRRVQRPQPARLNPFRSFVDPLNQYSGNPNLEPQETASYEVAWMRRANQTFYQATIYYRDTTGAFTNVFIDLGGGALLSRPENLGSSRSLGLELVANGRLHPTLRYNASLNFYNQQIDASNLGYSSQQEANTTSGRLNFNWTPTDRDFLQIGGQYTGEQLFANGRREPTGAINLGYRRKLNDRLSLQLTVRDLFDTQRSRSVYETPILRDESESRFGRRTAFIGLTWTFGRENPRQPPSFDFSAGPGPGG